MSDYETWTRDEVAEWPGAVVTFGKRAKHREAVLTFGEASRFVIFPDSPSDNARGVYNHIGIVRRELAAMGAVRNERAKAAGPKRVRNAGAGQRDLIEGERGPVKPDPWEALQALADQPLITAPGAYSGIPNEVYHRDPGLLPGPSISSSGLKTLLGRSPRHYWYDSPLNQDRPPEKDKPHFNVGKAAHDLLLLSERWPECYHVLPEDFNARATREQAEYHCARSDAIEAGKVVLKYEEAETVKAMARSLLANPYAAAALANGESEVTLAWQDPETGVWLRARPDFLSHAVRNIEANVRAVPDLKTAADGSPRAFARQIANFGYAQSAALYSDGIKAIFGAHPTNWLHIVLEKEPPHVVSLYELPGEDIERGRWLNRKAIRVFAECLSTDKWPGYSDEPSQIGLPGWERKMIDDDTTLHDLAWSAAA